MVSSSLMLYVASSYEVRGLLGLILGLVASCTSAFGHLPLSNSELLFYVLLACSIWVSLSGLAASRRPGMREFRLHAALRKSVAKHIIMAAVITTDWWTSTGIFGENLGRVPWFALVQLAQAGWVAQQAAVVNSVGPKLAAPVVRRVSLIGLAADLVLAPLLQGATPQPLAGLFGGSGGLLVAVGTAAALVLLYLRQDRLLFHLAYNRPLQVPLALQEECRRPFTYLATRPGKGVRTKFMRIMRRLFPVSDGFFEEVCHFMDELHVVSLMLDDIQDHSVLRRGLPCSHLVHGTPQTINAACLQLMLANSRLFSYFASIARTELVHIIQAEICRAFLGQGLELCRRESPPQPSSPTSSRAQPRPALAPMTLAEYRLVVSCKTTVIFRLGCVVLMAQSGAVPSASIISLLGAGPARESPPDDDCDGPVCGIFRKILDIVEDIGYWFQVRDDLRNLTSYEDSKGFCDDFSEGKWSYPVLVFVELCKGCHEAVAKEFLDLLSEKPTDLPTKRRMLAMLQERGAVARTVADVEALERDITKRITGLGLPGLDGLIALFRVA
jgi:geranylgeranyl diphosphate synthase type 3